MGIAGPISDCSAVKKTRIAKGTAIRYPKYSKRNIKINEADYGNNHIM